MLTLVGKTVYATYPSLKMQVWDTTSYLRKHFKILFVFCSYAWTSAETMKIIKAGGYIAVVPIHCKDSSTGNYELAELL